MRLFILTVLTFLSSSKIFGQSLFESGYIIKNGGEKQEVKIDISSLNYSQEVIAYKASNSSIVKYASPSDIKAFEVSGYKFIAFKGYLDLNKKLTSDNEPDPGPVNIFIRQHIEGEYDLFEYRNSDIQIYLFRAENDIPTQLYSISFLRPDKVISINRLYRQQISKSFTCPDISESDIKKLSYALPELAQMFEIQNTCYGNDQINYPGLNVFSPKYLNIGFSVGMLNYSIASTSSIQNFKYATFKDITVPNLAAEFEYLIPLTQNRFSIWLRTDYRNFTDSDPTLIESRRDTAQLNFQSLEAAVGGRWYINRSGLFQFFTDAGVSKSYQVGNGVSINYQEKRDFNEVQFPVKFTIGAGILIKNRYSIDARLEYLDKRISENGSQEDFNISIITFNFKYLLKSYYK